MRQLTFTKFEIGFQEMRPTGGNSYELVTVPVGEVEATHLPKSEIRKHIQAAGYQCPRGLDVFAKPIAKVVYYFETEDLLAISKKRDEIPLIAGTPEEA